MRTCVSSGSMNPLPGVTMWVACAAWIVYACFLNDIYVFLASLPGTCATGVCGVLRVACNCGLTWLRATAGFLFGVFYLITAAAFCSKPQRLQMLRRCNALVRNAFRCFITCSVALHRGLLRCGMLLC
jgi:hypothetical protein